MPWIAAARDHHAECRRAAAFERVHQATESNAARLARRINMPEAPQDKTAEKFGGQRLDRKSTRLNSVTR